MAGFDPSAEVSIGHAEVEVQRNVDSRDSEGHGQHNVLEFNTLAARRIGRELIEVQPSES